MLIHTTGLPGIYLHIPFCIKKCGYCDFYSQTDLNLRETFIQSVIHEIELYHKELNPTKIFDTIYFGGGTPSLLSASQIDKILHKITGLFKISDKAEITLEINPGTLEASKFADFHKAGVNRLSIGIQSFHEDELQFLDRIHSVNASYNCVEAARQNLFDNIGVDLIFGLPMQNAERWQHNLTEATKLSPEHISVYNLTIEKNTPFYKRMRHGEIMNLTDEPTESIFIQTVRYLKEKGYQPYEISNYAKSLKHVSRHNIKYWFHVPYLGFGPSAHSFWQGRRWSNKADLHSYMDDMGNGQKPIVENEVLTIETEEFEQILLSMRTYQGLQLERFSTRFGHKFTQTYSYNVNLLLDKGLAELSDGYFRLNPKGMLLSDEIISNFHH